MPPLLRALRPAQWVKNVFVLAPLVFARHLFDVDLVERTLLAFFAFCAASATVYLWNDLRDREEDRKHPLKRHRPIASGALSVGTAIVASLALAAAAAGAAVALGREMVVILVVYLALNLLYSGGLKRVVLVDVMLVAMGYVLRVLGGSAAIGVETSHWLLLCTILLALFLVLSKRRHEVLLLAGDASEHRAVLGHYSPAFLDQLMNVVTASSVVAFALYAVDAETVARFGSDRLVWTMPLVLFGVFRYLYLVYQQEDRRNPTEAVLTDVPSLVNLLLWVVAVTAIVYGGSGGA